MADEKFPSNLHVHQMERNILLFGKTFSAYVSVTYQINNEVFDLWTLWKVLIEGGKG